jgi:hypothetical protein
VSDNGDLETIDMLNTRRSFLQSTAALATGLAGGASLSAQGQGGRPPITSAPDSEIKIPKLKFGKVEISRLILGVNPFYGFGHYNQILTNVMKEWYTAAKVLEVMQRSESLGINAFNYFHSGRSQSDWERYLGEGGKMHIVAQAHADDPAELVNAVKPAAVWVQGERTDNAYRAGQLNTIGDYCKKLRDLGVGMVGVGSHIPEVLTMVYEKGWDVDFYAGCVYNRRRTPEELRKALGGELPEMSGEVYLQDDPARMYKVFRQIQKPCVAFKILAAGRVGNPEAAFRQAFQSMKPTDFVCVGMFPRIKDEVKENAYFASLHGAVSA